MKINWHGVLHAAGVALGAGLVAISTMPHESLTHDALFGVAVGLFSRVLGAVIAYALVAKA